MIMDTNSYYVLAIATFTIFIIITCLLHVGAQYSPLNNTAALNSTDHLPSSNVNDGIFSYYYPPQRFYMVVYSNFTHCDNDSLWEALNKEQGLYGLPLPIYSSHYYYGPYIVHFQLFFVIAADQICSKSNSSTYLSLVAFRENLGKSRDLNKVQVVWTANVDTPVSENACLQLNTNGDGDGNLKLVDYDANKTVWQTNYTNSGATNTSLTITYEGNLVLFTNTTSDTDSTLKQRVFWQSYDEPTDTLMVLQVLRYGRNLTTTSITPKSTSKSFGSSNKTAKYKLVLRPGGAVVLFVEIGYQYQPDASYISQPYESQYWASAPPHSNDTKLYDAALCWYPGNQSNLYLVFVSANGSDVSNYHQVSPDTCSSQIGSDRPERTPCRWENKGANHANNGNITYATFVRLEADGDLHAYTVDNTTYSSNNTAVWRSFSGLFGPNRCHLPLFCGFYGLCDEEKQKCISDCRTRGSDPVGAAALEPHDSSDPKSGCRFRGEDKWEPNGSCSSLSTKYALIQGAHYFSSAFMAPHYTNITHSSCWHDYCSKDCTCTAAFWQPTSGNASSCFLIQGPLATIIVNASDPESKGYLKFIEKVSPPYYAPPKSTTIITVSLSLGGIVLLIAILAAGYILCMRRRKARLLEDRELEMELLGVFLLGSKPRRFTWDEVRRCTCGFSDPLGSGGFGNVFRGAMADGTPVAVKQLIDGRQQGSKEFMAEVSILGRTHHLHLVRLIGFCLEGAGHKLLVYEYMENGSLDAWIFSKKPGSHVAEPEEQMSTQEKEQLIKPRVSRPTLAWQQRFDIALGTARGLAYLHEECEDRVIHMDLKPQNILLGANFFPKIADFGMSRRVARGPDQESAVMTLMRGTPGYLAPEWLTDGAVTEKCDVYSYGIVVLEIVSGKRVLDWRPLRQKLQRSGSAGEGVMEIVDERLMSYGLKAKAYDEEQAMRMVEVAMLCVVRDPRRRPSMTSVVQMLEGNVEVIPHAPIDDYMQDLGLLPSSMSKNYMRMKHDGGVEAELWEHGDDESGSNPYSSWRSGSFTSSSKMMMMGSRKTRTGGHNNRYMDISSSLEYMDSS